jgi:diaminohydroxyphosphoribosylaminopyrimidine deaminase/5-amino-6-(5-phosphoribosylamino)uracil reductase
LKWAETADGFIDFERTKSAFGEPTWITGEKALIRVHQMRALEDAILVGTNTALKDNPSLTVRHCPGKNPVRLLIDNHLRLPDTLHLFDGTVKTIVFNSVKSEEKGNIEFIKTEFNRKLIPQILKTLYQKNIQSLIVEGGKQLLDSFIEAHLWDEAFRFVGNKFFYRGINAPEISGTITDAEKLDSDQLIIYRNNHQ